MPAKQQVNPQIIPRYRLPENKRRPGEGGRRLVQGEEALERPVPLISVVTIVLNGENYVENYPYTGGDPFKRLSYNISSPRPPRLRASARDKRTVESPESKVFI